VALTAPSAKQSFTYERKEFLGDTALKVRDA
jgi:dsRNA-specific ribonuclease